MDVLPAIDLRAGQVVRLAQGDYARQTTYGSDPAAMAEAFVAAGCRWIHVVDLDAAKSGQITNLRSIEAIVRRSGARVEVGGGIRDDQAAQRVLDVGVERVIVGSAAMKNWPWFERLMRRPEMAQRVALGLDARDGRVAAEGWTEQLETTAVELARLVAGWPVAAIIYTDIARDGMLTGPNVAATAQLVAATDVPVVASGGVARLEDIAACRDAGCAGAIVGRAYYEGRIELPAALRVASSGTA